MAALTHEQLLEHVIHCIEQGFHNEAGLWARLLVRDVRNQQQYLEHHAAYCKQCSRAMYDANYSNYSLCEEGEKIYQGEL